MKKLAITEECEEDKYDHLTSVKCWPCDPQNRVEMPEAPNDPKGNQDPEAAMEWLFGHMEDPGTSLAILI